MGKESSFDRIRDLLQRSNLKHARKCMQLSRVNFMWYDTFEIDTCHFEQLFRLQLAILVLLAAPTRTRGPSHCIFGLL